MLLNWCRGGRTFAEGLLRWLAVAAEESTAVTGHPCTQARCTDVFDEIADEGGTSQ